MSKIDDAIFEIKQYLSGNDHSDNPRIRQASQVYAQACRELNAKLADCRQLIDRGLLLDAQKLAAEMTPSLSERAEKLILPAALFNRYQELCRLYGYTTAPDIDRSALEQLTKSTGGKEEIFKELILRWRKIARTGSNLDKMKLLRLIISNEPADDKIWRTNLASVERQWVNDLLKEAERAIKEEASEKIAQIYMALTDPELLKPAPDNVLEKLKPYVRKHQQKMLEQDLEKKRIEIFNAYSSQNIDLISERLREYDMMTTNPLYTVDADAEKAVQEVRDYLQEQITRRNTEQFHATKLAELIQLLDKHGDYALIENAYVALQKTDIPLDRLISQRVMNRREEYLLESGRKHTRKVIYSIFAAVIILMLAIFVFHVVQSTRTFFSYQKSMQNLMASGNNQGVLKLHDEIKKNNPILLQFGNLTALRMEAEKAIEAQNDLEKKINNYLTSAETLLKSKNPQLEELKQIQKELDDLQVKDMPSELASRQQKINFAIRRLEFDTQQRIDQDYLAQQKKCLKNLETCQAMLEDSKISLDDVQNRIVSIMNFMQNLTNNSTKVTESIRNTRNTMVQEQGKSLLNELNNIKARRQLIDSLYMPKHFTQYSEALKKLPSDAPDLATGVWRPMLTNIYAIQALVASTNLTIYNTHAELEKALTDSPVNIGGNNCFVRDITRLLPDKYFSIKYTDAVNLLRADLSALYNCYELTFVDQDDIKWHFYSADKPQVDKSRTSRIPKALGVSVMMLPGAEGKFLPIMIDHKSNGKITFIPKTEEIKELALPDKFVELKNMKITSTIFPKSKHFTVLEDTLKDLSRCKDPRQLPQMMVEPINRIVDAEDMNIFAQAYILRRLLDIYALASDFHRMAVSKPCHDLDYIAQHLYAQWYVPTVEAANPDAVKSLKEFFKKFSINQLATIAKTSEDIYRLALSRGLTPGGVVYQESGNQFKVHWFSGNDVNNELWFFLPGANNTPAGWIALDKKNNVDPKSKKLINHNLKMPHGTVFFVPFDNRDTGELARKVKATADTNDVKSIFWPETWPLNKR